jgi:pentatricopeptide repeat protein
VCVYNALLELCAASNDVGRATELLERMASEGVRPDEFTERAVEGKRALRSALRRTFA